MKTTTLKSIVMEAVAKLEEEEVKCITLIDILRKMGEINKAVADETILLEIQVAVKALVKEERLQMEYDKKKQADVISSKQIDSPQKV